MENFKEEKPYYIADVSKQKEEPVYNMLHEQNVDRLLAVPLKRDGNIIGFLGVDNPVNHYEDMALLSLYNILLLIVLKSVCSRIGCVI